MRAKPVLLTILCVLLSSGCALRHDVTRYQETYGIEPLGVVFVDERSLVEIYEARYARPATQLAMRAGLPQSINRVKAFYDFGTHTIYCVKWDFENCGHELHHAVLGRFHPESR